MIKQPARSFNFQRLGVHLMELLSLAFLLMIYCAADATRIDFLLPGASGPSKPILISI